MSNPTRLRAFVGVLLFLLCTVSARAEYADPPGRVARLNFSQGEVSFSPAGENDWVTVVRNRPLFRGDRLWSDHNSLAEFQVGSAAVRLGSNTGVEILNLDDNIAQFQLSEGTLNLGVRRLYPGQVYEVDTPTLAFTINREGNYRIDVDPNNNITTIQVRKGAGEAYGENANFPMIAGDNVNFYDASLHDYQLTGMPPEDAFDRFCSDRDLRLSRSASLRYLDDDVVGYADLDKYGNWRPVSSYGPVWFPSSVDAGWAPYRDGHWVWQEPWGWTWVDDAPWGFAPSHYGRWVHVTNRWGWVPGPRHVRPVYAPALVAFIGGNNWSLSISTGSPIGWFPLGPREAYVPSYHASRDYFRRVNVNNTVINNTTIVNVYNDYSSGRKDVRQGRHANRMVAGAVTAVPRNVFVNAQPVRHAAIHLDKRALSSGEVTSNAPVAPSARSVFGAGKDAKVRPARKIFERKVFARNAPPPAVKPFAAREQLLQKNPGRALEPDAIKRDDKTERKVRVLGKRPGSVDARAAGSRRSGNKSPATPAQPNPQDRSTQPGSRSTPVSGDKSKGNTNNAQRDAQKQAERQRQVDTQQQQLRQRKANSAQQAAKQKQAERQQQVDKQQQQLRQRKANSAQQAAKQKQAEHQQQVDKQQQQQRQRKANSAQQAAKQKQAERQQQVDKQQQQQRQRKANSAQQAAKQKQAERQQQVDKQQQQQRQRKANSAQQAAKQKQAERQQQVDKQQQGQRKTAPPDRMQRQAPPQPQNQVVKQHGNAVKAQTAQEKLQAKCEQQAKLQHRDPKQCLKK